MSSPTALALRAHLDGRWRPRREAARALAADPRFQVRLAGRSVDEQRTIVLDQLHLLADLGFTRAGFPAAQGGEDDLGGFVAGFEMLAMGDLSLLVKVGVQFGLFGGAILNLGTAPHHERYLADVMAARLLGCFAMTEHGRGSDVASLRTTATFSPRTGEFVIRTPDDDASKDYIGNAGCHGRLAVVFAQLLTAGQERGVHAFLVPIRDAGGGLCDGVRIRDDGVKGGLDGVDNGRIWFDDVRIPRENLLNRFGDVAADGSYSTPIESPSRRFFTMLGTLVQGRVSVAGAAVSATEVALTIAVRYGERRTQFTAPDGSPIAVLDYLTHQRRLLPALARTYAMHFAQGQLLERLVDTPFDDDEGRRQIEAHAAGLKATATWHALHTVQACREACGGAGYMAENRLTRMRADVDVFTTFEGDNTVLLELLAKELLTGFRDHLGDLDALGTARFVADQAAEAIAEKVGAWRWLQRLRDVTPSPSEDGSIADHDWQLMMFAWRARHVLESLARRLRRAADTDDPREQFAIFNAAQDHLLAAARAHMDELLLEAFVNGIDAMADGPPRDLLIRVSDLFAISTLEAERGWFAEHGRLTAARSKQLVAAVNELCAELRPHARTLVDAFGVPAAALDVPLLAPVVAPTP
ncbi:MAG: acyl-CoA oxidase [Jatrophihabitans sp.]|nr:MAG: acyl-CoA oxidase [Jatrophihabitans sp.]